jgi:hypothetical protein
VAVEGRGLCANSKLSKVAKEIINNIEGLDTDREY